jgi:hypothetical protein
MIQIIEQVHFIFNNIMINWEEKSTIQLTKHKNM